MKLEIGRFAIWRHASEGAGEAVQRILDALRVTATQITVVPLSFGGERVEVFVDLAGKSQTDFLDMMQAQTGSIGLNVHVWVDVPIAPPAPDPTLPRGTNQQVFNALAKMLGLIPASLASYMGTHRDDRYSGPAVEAWGLGEVDQAAVIAALRAAGLA